MRLIILLSLAVSSLHSFATDKPKVIYFGGHKATLAQMAKWKASALSQFGEQYDVDAVPYPPTPVFNTSGPILAAASKMNFEDKKNADVIKHYIEEIKSNPRRTFILAGHSSGSAVSNHIAKELHKMGVKNFKLVILDGYPAPRELSVDQVSCYMPKTGGINSLDMKVCGGDKSVFNARNPRSNYKTLDVPRGCTSLMCTHFAIVDHDTPRELGSDYGSNGYKNPKANFGWVPKAEPRRAQLPDSSQSVAPAER